MLALMLSLHHSFVTSSSVDWNFFFGLRMSTLALPSVSDTNSSIDLSLFACVLQMERDANKMKSARVDETTEKTFLSVLEYFSFVHSVCHVYVLYICVWNAPMRPISIRTAHNTCWTIVAVALLIQTKRFDKSPAWKTCVTIHSCFMIIHSKFEASAEQDEKNRNKLWMIMKFGSKWNNNDMIFFLRICRLFIASVGTTRESGCRERTWLLRCEHWILLARSANELSIACATWFPRFNQAQIRMTAKKKIQATKNMSIITMKRATDETPQNANTWNILRFICSESVKRRRKSDRFGSSHLTSTKNMQWRQKLNLSFSCFIRAYVSCFRFGFVLFDS